MKRTSTEELPELFARWARAGYVKSWKINGKFMIDMESCKEFLASAAWARKELHATMKLPEEVSH